MSLLEAIVLGLLQGLTEFLPISSTAHLRFVPALVGWDDPGAAFTAITQVGTLAAVVLYFRAELGRMAHAWAASLRDPSRRGDRDARLAWYVIVGTLPIVVFGAIFAGDVETAARDMYLLAAAMIGLGVLLYISERVASHVKPIDSLGMRDAIAIGLAQALALIPGTSRSGATLTMGLFLGLRREDAARFSFLLSVPAVFASGAYEAVALIDGSTAIGVGWMPLAVGTILAFLSGYAAIDFLLRFLRTHSTLPFVAYRIAVGALILALLGVGAI